VVEKEEESENNGVKIMKASLWLVISHTQRDDLDTD